MGQLDEHLHASATPLLRPAEQITAHAHLRIKPRSTGSTGDTYKDWLVAATNQRLLFFPGKETMTLNIAPGGGGEPFFVELRDLAEVRLVDKIGLVGDYRRLVLVSIGGRGPRGLDGRVIDHRVDLGDLGAHEHLLIVDLRSETKGLDHQQDFHRNFPGWLAQQVATRAFWGPEDQAAFEAAQAATAEKERAEAERKRQAAEKRAQAVAAGVGAMKRSVGLIGPVLLMLLGLGAAGVCGVLFVDGYERSGRDAFGLRTTKKKIEILESDVKWRRTGKEPPRGCPGKDLPYWSGRGCHGCQVSASAPSRVPEGYLAVQSGGRHYLCPPLEDYEKDLAKEREHLKTEQEMATSPTQLALFGGGAGAGLILLIVGIVWLVRKLRRRRSQEAAASVAPTV